MYILYAEKLNKYYVGACTDLERRLYEHNIGHSKFTEGVKGFPQHAIRLKAWKTATRGTAPGIIEPGVPASL